MDLVEEQIMCRDSYRSYTSAFCVSDTQYGVNGGTMHEHGQIPLDHHAYIAAGCRCGACLQRLKKAGCLNDLVGSKL